MLRPTVCKPFSIVVILRMTFWGKQVPHPAHFSGRSMAEQWWSFGESPPIPASNLVQTIVVVRYARLVQRLDVPAWACLEPGYHFLV
jgi:hypothetical protein